MIAWALAVVATGWVAVLLIAPIVQPPVSAVTYLFASLICHQISDRSFQLDGIQLPVCARCFGIYGGAALGLLAYAIAPFSGAFRAPSFTLRRWLNPRAAMLAAVCANLVSVLLEWAGLWGSSNLGRALLGGGLGLTTAIVVARALATLHYGGCAPRRPTATSQSPRQPI